MTYRPGNCRSCDLFFFPRRCKGQGSGEGVDISRQDEFRREMGELQCRRRNGQELATNHRVYCREKDVYTADYLTDSRLLAQSRSSILEFHEYARNYFSLQAEVHYRKICIFKRKRKKKRIVYSFGHTSRKFNQKSEGNK